MIIFGKIHWAKVLGEPQPGYGGTKNEWSFDVTLTDEAKESLEKEGVNPKAIRYSDDLGYFVKFKRPEFNSKGKENKPYPIKDRRKELWDQETLIGNGSDVAVQFEIVDTAYGRYPYASGIQIIKHVPYGQKDEFEVYDDDESVVDDDENWDES